MALVFKIGGTDISGYIKNDPKVSLTSRDTLKYFSFQGSSVPIEVPNDTAILNQLTDGAFATIERGGTIIWTGYVDGFSKVNRQKDRLIKYTLVPEINRLKDLEYSDADFAQTNMYTYNNAILSLINNSGFSGYTLVWNSANPISRLNCIWRPLEASTLVRMDNSYGVSVNPFYVEGNQNIYVHTGDEIYVRLYNFLWEEEVGTPANITPAVTTTEDIPLVGTVETVSFPDTGILVKYFTFVYEGFRQVWGYSEFEPFKSPLVKYENAKVSDIWLDTAKFTDSIFHIFNKQITFNNNLSGNSYNLTASIIEDIISYRDKFDFTDLDLALQIDDTDPTKYIRADDLVTMYNLKFGQPFELHSMKLLTSSNLKPGYDLTVNGQFYGRITDVSMKSQDDSLVEVKTELPADA